VHQARRLQSEGADTVIRHERADASGAGAPAAESQAAIVAFARIFRQLDPRHRCPRAKREVASASTIHGNPFEDAP
jgi:hypothetical protein